MTSPGMSQWHHLRQSQYECLALCNFSRPLAHWDWGLPASATAFSEEPCLHSAGCVLPTILVFLVFDRSPPVGAKGLCRRCMSPWGGVAASPCAHWPRVRLPGKCLLKSLALFLLMALWGCSGVYSGCGFFTHVGRAGPPFLWTALSFLMVPFQAGVTLMGMCRHGPSRLFLSVPWGSPQQLCSGAGGSWLVQNSCRKLGGCWHPRLQMLQAFSLRWLGKQLLGGKPTMVWAGGKAVRGGQDARCPLGPLHLVW